MEKLFGSSRKRTEALKTQEEYTWNTGVLPPIIPSVSCEKRIVRILVVDDDESIRRIMSRYLGYMGFDVIEASNGYKGQHLFLNMIINLVITELEIPGLDSWTLVLNIKKEAPYTPVIMVTDMDEESFIQNKKENCIDIVMFKPFRMKDLGENIKRMLGPVCGLV
jgi:DNA-binding response OmpR family regulator